ncbi:MAG: aminoglycoside 3-N-acetyltransferase [Devosia nanyangense]|uniref:Aminoglycoside N(3)-acetyltransferase n=1 Tax=Devosia nanyangense TaxID=1228055 RepID=A0A933L7C8_9HYPH|nr:aminoglycoside 3-N-acetyltransferase [Devosia nanyangense]
MTERFATRRSLAADLRTLGLIAGDAVLVHAGLRSVGPIVGGPDALIAALSDAVGARGSILGYADWQIEDDRLADPAFRDDIPPFDPPSSRATRDNGAFPELLRTTPGARRSASPGASCVALGGPADWFVADHALDYGYGPHSPFGKLVEAGGKVLMLGAPLDTMTLLHHAEHLADIPNKRIKRYETPIVVDGKTVWRSFEEFDTSHAPEGLPEDYFVALVEDFLATGQGTRGTVGAAPSVLVAAKEIVPFAVSWLERRFRSAS